MTVGLSADWNSIGHYKFCDVKFVTIRDITLKAVTLQVVAWHYRNEDSYTLGWQMDWVLIETRLDTVNV